MLATQPLSLTQLAPTQIPIKMSPVESSMTPKSTPYQGTARLPPPRGFTARRGGSSIGRSRVPKEKTKATPPSSDSDSDIEYAPPHTDSESDLEFDIRPSADKKLSQKVPQHPDQQQTHSTSPADKGLVRAVKDTYLQRQADSTVSPDRQPKQLTAQATISVAVSRAVALLPCRRY